jgi:hypothetical protein
MLLENILPNLPSTNIEYFMFILGLAGTFLLVYGIFLETEKRQDIIFMLGSFALFIYALFIMSPIFSLAMLGFFVASSIEFIEIFIVIHQHKKYDLKKIIRENRKKIKK